MNAVMTSDNERASWGGMTTMMDDVIRQRCRTAPLDVRRNIDTRREARGLRPLWPGVTRQPRARAAARLAVVRHRAFLALAQCRQPKPR
jgi:hypothetical protein